MSEKRPEDESKERESRDRESYETGQMLLKEDEVHPVRGVALRLTRKVVSAAYTQLDGPLYKDLQTVQDAFINQFENRKDAYRYRLYHVLIGGSPPGSADLFDGETEGQISIEEGLRRLAEKHHIDITDTV